MVGSLAAADVMAVGRIASRASGGCLAREEVGAGHLEREGRSERNEKECSIGGFKFI